MKGMDFIGIVLLFFLSLWSALYMESSMKKFFMPELFAILLLIIIGFGITYALFSGRKWAWHSAAGFFLIALFNCAFMFYFTREKVPFAVCLFVNAAGLGTSVVKFSGDFLAGLSFQKPSMPPEPSAVQSPKPEEPTQFPKPYSRHAERLWTTQPSAKPYYQDDSDVLVELETYGMDSDILAPKAEPKTAKPNPARKKTKKKSARKSGGKKKIAKAKKKR